MKITSDQLKDSNELTITQTGHGFVVNDWLIYDKNTSLWQKANSAGVYANGSIGRVIFVVDTNSFIIKTSGYIIDFVGDAGEFYYVKDDGTGGLTLTPPINQIQATLFALPGNKAVSLSYPSVTPSTPATGSISTGDLIMSLSDSVAGYLKLDGAVLSKTVYSNLWSWLQANPVWISTDSTKFIDIDSNTFSLPNFGSVFFRNAGTSDFYFMANGIPYLSTLADMKTDAMEGFLVPEVVVSFTPNLVNNTTAPLLPGISKIYDFPRSAANFSVIPRVDTQTHPYHVVINHFIKF